MVILKADSLKESEDTSVNEPPNSLTPIIVPLLPPVVALSVLPDQDRFVPAMMRDDGVWKKESQLEVEAVSGILKPAVSEVTPVPEV